MGMLGVVILLSGCILPRPACMGRVTTEHVDFMGWSNSWRIANGSCEMIVVPAISHVMKFALVGGSNVLWSAPDVNGSMVQEPGVKWHNFGGDKVWPTEESRWRQIMKRRWPPSYEFDGGAGVAEPIPRGIRLTTPEDPNFGAVCVREFVMDPVRPLVVIHQWFEKRRDPPVPMMFWTITQVRHADANLLPLGEKAGDGLAYRPLGALTNVSCSVTGSWLALVNNDTVTQKAGVGSRKTLDNGWVAALYRNDRVLFVQSHVLERGGVYPDQGCQAEVFTSDREFGLYTELELLSPVTLLAPGQHLRHDVVWQLVPLHPEELVPVPQAGVLAEKAHRMALRLLGSSR